MIGVVAGSPAAGVLLLCIGHTEGVTVVGKAVCILLG